MTAFIVFLSMVATTADSGVSTATLTVSILGSAGVTAVLGAIVTAFANRRKLGADATEIITKAAAGVVGDARADNVRLRAEVARLERKVDILQRGMDEAASKADLVAGYLQLHASWDYMAIQELRKHGLDFTDPPPLYPPGYKPGEISKTLHEVKKSIPTEETE